MDRPKDQQILPAAVKVPASSSLVGSEVLAYLRRHPNFLIEHPDVLQVLTPPAIERGDGVVDLQHFMLQRLQTEITRLKNQQRSLIAVSRANLATQSRIHSAVLTLLAAPSFEHLIHTVTNDFAVLLDADVITLGVESARCGQTQLRVRGVQLLAPGLVDEIFGADHNVVLQPEIEGDPMLFGSGAGLVRSAALLRLRVSQNAPAGMLSIGARRAGKFHSGQGTELLGFLARSLEIVIAGWLDLPV